MDRSIAKTIDIISTYIENDIKLRALKEPRMVPSELCTVYYNFFLSGAKSAIHGLPIIALLLSCNIPKEPVKKF